MYKYELTVKYDTIEEYQKEFLKVFDILDDYDEEKINVIRGDLYKTLVKVEVFNNLFTKSSKQLVMAEDDDNEWGMVGLFQYDYFETFHKCIQLFYNKDDEFLKKIKILNDLL